MNTAITKRCLLALCGVGLGLATTQTQATAQTTWRMNLSQVGIVRQREASGDRPYFAIIQFRSRFGTRGSTQVNVISHEPHDWVSKPALRGTLPPGRDHMFTGESTTLPFWMREIEWRNLSQVPEPIVGGRLDPERLAAALTTDVVGVVIVGLDNNNTPPHVVRGLADTIGNLLNRTLREDVEGNLSTAALTDNFQRNLEAKLQRLALQAVTLERGIDLAGQLTLGSTFNPDQLTGIQVQIIPALDRFTPQEQTRTLDLPTVVTGGPVQARSQIQALQPWSQTLTFQGSGADYRVQASMAQDVCPATEILRSLSVSMLSGDDGLRDNSSLALELEVAGRGSILVPFGGGDGDRRFNAITRTVTIPPIARRDLRRVGLRFTSRFSFPETHDNWTLNALQVRGNGRTLLAQSGRPVFRFSGDTPRFMTDISCTPPTAATTEPTVRSLEITLRTGGDDLRGGNDNAFVFALLRDGRRIEVPFNRGNRLPDNTERTVTLSLPSGVTLSQIRRFGVRATLGGGFGGDNWNIDRLTVHSTFSNGNTRTLLEQAGSPLVRLTGDSRERVWDLRF